MNTPPSPVVLILAAGRSTRFIASGGTLNKLQTPLCGLTVLDHVIRAAEQSGLPWHVVREADGDGMGDTIAAGVRATADAGVTCWTARTAVVGCLRAVLCAKKASATAW